MITKLDSSRFAIDFSKVKRPHPSAGRALMGVFSKRVTEVDAFAVAQALRAVLHHCSNLDVEARLTVWNDFRLFLDRRDYEELRKKAPTLQHQLGPALEDEVMKLKAGYLGAPVLRLHVDEGGEVEPGHGVLKVDWNPDEKGVPSAAGEVTVRLDKPGGPAPGAPQPGPKTERAGNGLLKHSQGSVPLSVGLHYVLGRSHPGASPEHIAIPGATGRINKRQVGLDLEASPLAAVVTREPGESNPVSVNGQPLAPGESIRANLPVKLLLSNELKLEILPC